MQVDHFPDIVLFVENAGVADWDLDPNTYFLRSDRWLVR